METSLFQKALWIIPVLLALAVNQNVLRNGFGWDDEAIIQNIKAPEDWRGLFGAGPGLSPSKKTTTAYFRPLVSFSYRLDRLLWGTRPFGFHFSVWLAHILNTALVFFLARELLAAGGARGPIPAEGYGPSGGGRNILRPYSFVPLIAASLFAVHPAHAEAVAWIAGRNDVFATAFMVASFLGYIHFHRSRSIPVLGLSVVFFFMALLTKEMAVGLIFVFPLYELLARPPSSGPEPSRPAGPVPRAAIIAVPFAAAAVFYFSMRAGRISVPFGSVSAAGWASGPVLAKAVIAFGYYFWMMLVPYPPRPFIDAIPSSPAALAMSLAAGLAVGAALVYAIRYRNIPLGAGLGWAAATVLPAVAFSVMDMGAAPAAERYVYGPSAGFLIALVYLASRGYGGLMAPAPLRAGMARAASGILVIGIIALSGWQTWQRNPVWMNTLAFWRAAAIASPESAFAHQEAGFNYSRAKRYEEAEFHLARAAFLYEEKKGPDDPDVGLVLNNLGTVYRSEGKSDAAEDAFKRALAIWAKSYGPDDSEVARGLYNLAGLYFTQGRFDEAETGYLRALSIWDGMDRPDAAIVAATAFKLGDAYRAGKKYPEAERYYLRAEAIWEKTRGPRDPYVASTLASLADVQRAAGNPGAAGPLYERAIEIWKGNPGGAHPELAADLHNLAGIYFEQKQYEKAEGLYRQAVSSWESALGPDHPNVAASLENYAALLRETNRDGEAEKLEERASAIRAKTKP